ncbi:MAG: AbrB/MazE/SpoVT family DNA-binding domain-containing protein [Candidatus Thermoplasmatota archaeon]|jgi:AbrB family looped-hinge helix DNA binding protein|nr:AbrB/MazE/SpoVT family DNA-binding domain-containing protein [Candidatus Thermoplasmatota archaeon]MDP7264490.1 AbrB/MazE/SpoVT family DNA-binding domain-containing protein [Candidatus Thermoplasmatota archaeon]
MDVTVSSKGQIVIPYHLREKYEIIQGTKLEISDDDGLIKLIPPVKLTSICGTWNIDMDVVEKSIEEERKNWR